MVDETTELETSTSFEDTQDEHAQSSSADSETEEDLLSVVQDAMRPPEDKGSQPNEQVEQVEEVVEASPTLDERGEENFKDVPFHSHPRFKKLIEERNEYRESAEQYDKITSFLNHNNVTAAEAAQGMQIMALMKNDPQAALQALRPYIRNLTEATGITMPDDIQKRVDDGYLDEEAGRELAKTRMDAARERAFREQMTNERNQELHDRNVHSMAMTVTQWENKTRQSDPDYELKADEIDDRVRVLVAQHGRPATPQQAIAMAQSAYDEVSKRYAKRFGNKRPMKTASGGKLGGTPTPEPKNLMEAVQNALMGGST